MLQKILYIMIAVTVGFTLNALNVPAGFLIGGLLTGITYGVLVHQLKFDGLPFRVALAFIGANIGLLLQADVLKQVHYLMLPLLMTIVVMMTSGFILENILQKRSSLDKVTAFFCTIPGGASEIIGLSGDYGADNRIVAAFHTVRITVFSLTIPFIVNSFNSASGEAVAAV